MSYQQCLERRYKDKASTYTAHQCRLAIVDIQATLALHKEREADGQMSAYAKQLCIEQDAMLDRLYMKKCK